jgi:membrane fusion protein, heavy metal efflux system
MMKAMTMITTIRTTFLLAAVALIVSCEEKKEQKHEHSDVVSLAYTLYSEKTEIFVEFRPLVVGAVTKFAAHFTVLGESFKPLTEGTVTVSLVVNGSGIRQSSDKPAVPGIYRLSLQPAIAGKGDLIFDIVTKNFTDRQVIKDVTVYPNEESAKHKADDGGSGNEITYLKEQAWKIDFANQEVMPTSFGDVIRTNATVRSAAGEESLITAKASGIVKFEGRTAIAGSPVKAGETLFTITGGNLTNGNVENRYKIAAAEYTKAKADYERAEKLIADKIISQRDYDQAKLAYDNAKIAYDAMHANYSGSGLHIKAPIDGFVNSINVTEGQFVEDGAPLATVSSNKEMYLQANISQRYFDKVPDIIAANFIVPGSDVIYDTEKLKGKVLGYGKGSSTGAAFIPVTFGFTNPGGLIPGTPVEAYLITSGKKQSLIVPKTALIEEQGIQYAYVQTAGESFEKREVKTGVSDGKNVEILSGISEGERVVTKGAYQIKLSTANGKMPAHGHEH